MSEPKAAWTNYYANTEGRPPRPTLLRALAGFEKPGFAVDLGCGDGRDTIELLRRGWSVLAIDAAPEGIRRLAARPDLPPNARLETRCARFEETEWPEADLVNASFTLFFSEPGGFPALWEKILRSLKPGGRFAGQLLGTRDSWAGKPRMVAFDRPSLDRLLRGLVVEQLEEEETDSVTPIGETKHWHIFHLVLKKP